jgi:hypothetical protein
MPTIQLEGRNILYMHVPKTAGMSVEAWLETLAPLHLSITHTGGWTHTLRCSPQHLDANDIGRLFQDGFFAYAFMFVRNPYARIESEYRYLRSQGRLCLTPADRGVPPDFAEWTIRELAAAELDPWTLDNHLRPQWEFAYPGADCFKLEDGLAKGLAIAAARIGAPAPKAIPSINRTAGLQIETRWNVAARDLVARRYARDFEQFGYTA